MKKIIALALACVIMSRIGAQTPSENEVLDALRSRVELVERELKATKSSNVEVANKVDALQSQLTATDANVDVLKEQITQTGESLKSTEGKLNGDIKSTNELLADNTKQTNESIKSRTNYGIIALVVIALIILLVTFLLRRRMSSSLSAIDSIKDAQNKLQSVQKTLSEESAKLDMKMIELLEKIHTPSPSTPGAPSGEGDHSLTLKVADEIVRIEMNLSRMDPAIKGYKQLSRAVERIKNNFSAKGYEISDLLNKTYNEGMRINADFTIDESLELGQRIITSITKPQVLFNGELIQKAIVTVSQNI